MSLVHDPFAPVLTDETIDDFDSLQDKPTALGSLGAVTQPGVQIARFQGFDLNDQPLLGRIEGLEGEVVVGRSTVPLRQSQLGGSVVVVFEHNDRRRPIVIGVLQDRPSTPDEGADHQAAVEVIADENRFIVSAEREISLRCGKASITLTRAGKVVIAGSYIVSRSSGYNRIKGAAVDIN